MASINGEVATLLHRLESYSRDPGAASDEIRNKLMQDAFNHLSGPTSSVNSSFAHWFCNKATRVTIECATFLIRLHAYASEFVSVWKLRCADVLHSCMECCASYQDRKALSRTT